MQLYSGPMEVQMLHSAKGKIWFWGEAVDDSEDLREEDPEHCTKQENCSWQ